MNIVLKITTITLLFLSTLSAISESDFVNDKNCDQIIDKDFLKICYNYGLKSAKAVSYTLYGDLVNELNIKNRPNFTLELALDTVYRISSSNYNNSGYDRGHLAPDAAFDWNSESLRASYSLANIIPQVPNINQRTWTKAEEYARLKAVELGKVNILNIIKFGTSPIRIGDNSMAVSSGYYKILYSDDDKYKECFYYKNDFSIDTNDDELSHHSVNCNKLYPDKKIDFSFLIPIIVMILK